MNLRFQKPIFQYIEKKLNPNAVIHSDNTLRTKEKVPLKENSKQSVNTIQQSKQASESSLKNCPQTKEIKSTKILKARQRLIQQTIQTISLYDRIAKDSITMNIIYVDCLKKEDDGKSYNIFADDEKQEIVQKENENKMTAIIKQEEANSKKRVSINTRIRLGSLILNGVSSSQVIKQK